MFTAGKIQSFLDFDSDEPIILILDWSALNIAGVLFQKQEGIEPFIVRWGRKCNCFEKHYPSMKGELLAFVKSIERWNHILKYCSPFLVHTKSNERIFVHWFSELAQFEFIVIHKNGVENINADALSRSNHLDKPTKAENEEYQKDNEVGELKVTYATDLDGDSAAA